MAKTLAAHNKHLRQENLRQYLSERGSASYLFDIIDKIEQLNEHDENFQSELNKLKAVADLRFKMLAKYLPDLKSVELQTENELVVSVQRKNYAGIEKERVVND
jgi:hypothetical protein